MKISIIVPIYNVEKYLETCLSSLVNQTLKDIEIIVIDDGSTDNSGIILDNYAKRHSNIKVFHQKNAGVSAARNKGLSVASGEYIGFIDGDDYADTTMFEKMYSYAKDNNLDIAVCDFYKKYESNTLKKGNLVDFGITNVNDNPILFTTINMAVWNKIFKKKLLKKVKFPTIKYEDFAIMLNLLINAEKIGKLSEYLVYYRIRNNSETGVVDKRVFDILTIVNNANKIFEEKKLLNKYYSEIEYFNIDRLIMYSLQQRVQIDKKIINNFIDKAHQYLNDNFKGWKNNKYFNKRNTLKLIIQKNKLFTKIYCNIYRRIKGVKYEKNR